MTVNLLKPEWLHKRHELFVRHVIQLQVLGHQVLAAHQLLVLFADEAVYIIAREELYPGNFDGPLQVRSMRPFPRRIAEEYGAARLQVAVNENT